MEYKRLCESDLKLMNVVWDSEPVGSTELVGLCAEKLGWKKSTTYTMLRKMCEKGFLKNEASTVTSIIPRDEVRQNESASVVEQTFEGSLPVFLAAFFGGRRISQKEAAEIKRLIDEHVE